MTIELYDDPDSFRKTVSRMGTANPSPRRPRLDGMITPDTTSLDAASPWDGVDEPAVGQIALTEVLAALAEPNRLALVRTLAATGPGGCSKTAALAGVTLSKSTLSHHIRMLKEAGVIHTWYVGATKYLSLRSDDLDARFPGVVSAVVAATR
jgi:DNA-binding transcriptional ArsR family regulator